MDSISFPSPLGPLTVYASKQGLTRLDFAAGQTRGDNLLLKRARQQLALWFAGKLQSFDLPLDLVGTQFQQAVWRELLAIPRGETCSYGQIAAKLGKPGAARAVGGACGANPLPIIIPCHRVVGSDGSLTGFGSGLDLKQKLLAMEGK